MRTFVSAKLHNVVVTDASVEYHGSVGISHELLHAANVHEFEQVHVVNLNNGKRWVTYAIGIEQPGQFTLNGGGARLGVVDDRCVILTYQTVESYAPAVCVYVDEHNRPTETFEYQLR